MSTKRMLIDAAHPEETRVVTVTGSRLEDFDVEVDSRKQLKGNIYLAKVTRVEPSLQAAFVDYGGNRHGFLAFNEIHPDYYQIPVADREKLIAEEEAAADDGTDPDGPGEDGGDGDEKLEEVGGDDVGEDIRHRRPTVVKGRYKIQEVIKRRQILLVQVVKEERGNKGAALTTYISLAGRYCVLMPNTARGGGVSRKIGSAADRKRLKSILSDLPISDGMAVIVRTAGSKRTKAEIKRDFDYLTRLWSQIRERTLESIAPCLIHEEADLIKRAVRDLYGKDIEEVVVEGDVAYRSAKDFMKLLIPSHAKRVQPYKDETQRLFQRYGVEGQLDAMYSPEVQLRSGGYIVINPTEALVSIDVNSGRSTRERNIEETAVATNIEAAQEIARQLRLRDLAGLIVIDFIDMDVNRNNARVERALKDAMKWDRARIQIGRISPFGLLELSRQRLRSSLVETSTTQCPHCEGTGVVRTTDSAALSLLRAVEAECIANPNSKITVHAATAIALYTLNHKRRILGELEANYGVTLSIEADDSLIAPAYRMDRTGDDGETTTVTDAHARSRQEAQKHDGRSAAGDDDGQRRRKRRSRRGGRRDEAPEEAETQADGADEAEAADGAEDETEKRAADDGDDGGRKRRRRGRRGGRRRGRKGEVETKEAADAAADASAPDDTADADADADGEPESAGDADAGSDGERPEAAEAEAQPEGQAETADDKPKKPRRRSRKKAGDDAGAKADADAAAPKKRSRSRRAKSTADAANASEGKPANGSGDGGEAEPAPAPEPAPVIAPEPDVAAPAQPNGNGRGAAPDGGVTPLPDQPEAARTTVIDVTEAKPQSARKGWWRRVSE